MKRFLAITMTAALAVGMLGVASCSRRPPAWSQPGDPAPAAAGPARVSTGTITLPTADLDNVSFTPAPFAMDSDDRGYPTRRVDRERLARSRLRMVDRAWKTVVLENEYLRVTMLPELGGQVFEAIFKPTGAQVFYRTDKRSKSVV